MCPVPMKENYLRNTSAKISSITNLKVWWINQLNVANTFCLFPWPYSSRKRLHFSFATEEFYDRENTIIRYKTSAEVGHCDSILTIGW